MAKNDNTIIGLAVMGANFWNFFIVIISVKDQNQIKNFDFHAILEKYCVFIKKCTVFWVQYRLFYWPKQ
jgi:hypothetical protein